MLNEPRRGKLDVISEILRLAKHGSNKTHIVYHGNLNFQLLRNYIIGLDKNGLIECRDTLIKTTEKGKQYLILYEQLKTMVW